MTLFRRLAIASTAAAFLLVAIGGLVRATKSGLGCGPNWPHCPGAVNRALMIEFSHRAVAGIVIVLLAALAVTAVRSYKRTPALMWPAVAAFGLVLFQAVLGAIVVWLELRAESVVLHLATAMILLALLVYLSVASLVLEGKLTVAPDEKTRKAGLVAALSVFALLLVGSYVTGTGAGYVFPDWPLMNGRLIPDLATPDQTAHFLHRLLAAVVGVVVLVVAVRVMRDKKRLPHQARLAQIAIGLFAVEVLIGAANVWSDLNAGWVTAHLALGAGIWASLIGVTVVSHPALAELRDTQPVRSSRAILEAS
ncbi:MAG TPA: COX15/CtaA family protein [Actinomycetota bacterium]|nr:COX15/CtaA family protein [Actinomycetota bacterium]